MADNGQHPQEVLRKEILADAQRQAERTLQRARKEAAGIAASAAAELDGWSRRQLDLARAEARRRADMILAGLPVETGRLRAARTEILLQSIYDETRQRLTSCDGLDRRQILIYLCAEAVRGMSGSRFSIVLSEADSRLLAGGELDAVRRLAGRPDLELATVCDPQCGDAGPVVRSSDGREYRDNRLIERLNRLWPALRLEIALRAALIEPLESKGEAP